MNKIYKEMQKLKKMEKEMIKKDYKDLELNKSYEIKRAIWIEKLTIKGGGKR